MRLPLRQSRLLIRHTKVKYIIIHHSICQYDIPEAKIDNAKFQIPGLINNVLEKKQPDINYHFILDKIKDDYQIIVCRPFVSMCEFDDIDSNINNAALHIAVLGSYNFKIPEQRLYEILAYRLLNPIMKHFRINPNLIYFHHDISSNKDETCPGSFINKEKLITTINRFIVK